jgi:hypothetical protein
MTFQRTLCLLCLLLVIGLAGCGSTASNATPSTDGGTDASPADAAADVADAAPTSFDGSGGGCTYDDAPGTITISAIEAPASSLEAACPNDGKHVAFTFAPDDDAAGAVPPSLAQLDEAVRRVTLGDGKDPPSSCLAPLGITVDAKLRATRRVATGGTCSPILYQVTVDLSTCLAQCG